MKKVSKKFLSIILTFALLMAIVPVGTMTVNAANMTLNELKAKFPQNAYWNHVAKQGHGYYGTSHYGSACGDVENTYTWTPCCTHLTPPYRDANPGEVDCNSFAGGIQCWAFARKLASLAYGDYSYANYPDATTKNAALSIIKPGDIVCYNYSVDHTPNDGHWIFVTGVSGSTISFGECNYGCNCQIRWDRTLNINSLDAIKVYSAPSSLVGSVTHTTHNYSEYVYYWDAHPHYKCYRCSCGDVKANKNETVYVSTCRECNWPGKPALADLNEQYDSTETINFSWNETQHTTHYNFWLYKKIANDEYQKVEFCRELNDTSISRKLPEGEYKVNLYSYNRNFYFADNSDWIYTKSDDYYFTVGHTHEYVLTGVETYCNNTAKIKYCCLGCSENFEKIVNITNTKSDFIEENISGLNRTTPTKTQYRSATKQTTTSTTNKEIEGWEYDKTEYSEYGEWSDWGFEPMESTDLIEVWVAPVYLWYAYVCPNCGNHDPYKGACSGCGTELTDAYWWAKWYNYPFSNGVRYDDHKTKTTNDFGLLFSAEDYDSRTGYRYKTRTATYYFHKWSDFTDWQDEEIVAGENSVVETRTIYSYDMSENSSHSYNKDYWEKDETYHWHKCSVCEDKTDIANHSYDDDSDTTCNVCGDVRKIDVVESEAQITVESDKAIVGKTITLDVSIKNNPGFSALNLAFLYDKQNLTLTNIENCIPGFMMTPESSIVWDGGSNYTADGKIATLTFAVSEEAEAKDYEIKVRFFDASNYDGETVKFATLSGILTVMDIVYGDVNGDSDVTTADLTLMRRYFASRDPETGEFTMTVSGGADANGDGNITTADLTALRRYFASRDPETGIPTYVLGPNEE